MKTKFLIFLGVLFLFKSCAIQVVHDYDKNANFNNYKTYSIYKPNIDSLAVNSLDKSRITSEINYQMKQKGLLQSENPDLLVYVKASSKRIINVDKYSDPWDYGWNPYWDKDLYVTEYKKGKIIIDLVDNNSNILVWEGVGDGIDVENLRIKAEQIQKTIQLILKNYPPKK